MTRDEAISENCKYFRTTLEIQAMTRSEDEIRKMAAAQIDFYVAIGLLKLDEPKSANALAFDAMVAVCGEKGGMIAPDYVLRLLDEAGLKVVKA